MYMSTVTGATFNPFPRFPAVLVPLHESRDRAESLPHEPLNPQDICFE